jgi:hypothetical protein
MIGGSVNELEPPYAIKILNANNLGPEVRNYISDLGTILAESRAWQFEHRGNDVEVSLKIE